MSKLDYPPPDANASEADLEFFIEARQNNVSYADLLFQHGWSRERLLTTATAAMRRGKLPPVNTGYYRQILRNLEIEIRLWLFDQTPEDATVAELIVNIIRDAYYEEHPEK